MPRPTASGDLVDRPTELFYIWIFICKYTNLKDTAGQSANGDRGGGFTSCALAGGIRGGWRGVQLVSSLVLRLELDCHRRQATIGQQGQAASQKITTSNTFGHQLSNHKYILN